MIYEEFNHLEQLEDKDNPFSNLYRYKTGETFYIEPVFYTQLRGFKDYRPLDYPRIIKEMERLVLKNKKVIFTGNFEFPQTEKEDYIILEITDVTDPLNIYAEDKSRGSDYGD